MKAVLIARCPVHGLHGERDSCHVCGGPVEQVEMVPLSDLREEWGVAYEQEDGEPIRMSKWGSEETARLLYEAVYASRAQGSWLLIRRLTSCEYVTEAPSR